MSNASDELDFDYATVEGSMGLEHGGGVGSLWQFVHCG